MKIDLYGNFRYNQYVRTVEFTPEYGWIEALDCHHAQLKAELTGEPLTEWVSKPVKVTIEVPADVEAEIPKQEVIEIGAKVTDSATKEVPTSTSTR